MAGKGTKWLLGCGIGCAAVILIGILLGTGSFLFFRETFRGFDHAVDARRDLTEQFGPEADFVPPLDGAIPADRMEAFLAVRDSLALFRERIDASFDAFSRVEEEIEEEESVVRKILKGLAVGKRGVGFGGDIGRFFAARNQALLEVGMGLGEYTYIFVLAYYSYLGHTPSDGPEDSDLKVEFEGDLYTRDRQEQEWSGRDGTSRRVRRDFLAMMYNLLDSLPPEGGSAAADTWRATVAEEISALEADRRRMVWQDGLPPALEASLRPYRDELIASYRPAVNVFELARNRKTGWSIRSD